jgi:hypothetical protein
MSDKKQGKPCYHPLSCRLCAYKGEPCGKHKTGEPGHQSCTGR